MKKTKLAYEVVSFESPVTDRDLTVLVNRHVNRVNDWAGHLGPARVISLCRSQMRYTPMLCTLTIEYTAYDTSEDA